MFKPFRSGTPLLLTPALGLLVVISLYPVLWSLGQSFWSDSISGDRKFILFGNYAQALWGNQARGFWGAISTTIEYTVISSTIELVLGVAMALLMNSIRRGRTLIRICVLVPWAVPTAVAVVVWRWMLQPDGIVNAIIGTKVIWTAGSITPSVAIIAIDVWKTTPFIALLVFAGLQAIPSDIHEAAKVDGAKWWRRLWYVTLPLARPAVLVAMIFRVMDLLRIYDTPAILTNGSDNTTTLSLFAYQQGISQVKVGFGSAISTLTVILIFGIALLLLRTVGRGVLRGATAAD